VIVIGTGMDCKRAFEMSEHLICRCFGGMRPFTGKKAESTSETVPLPHWDRITLRLASKLTLTSAHITTNAILILIPEKLLNSGFPRLWKTITPSYAEFLSLKTLLRRPIIPNRSHNDQ